MTCGLRITGACGLLWVYMSVVELKRAVEVLTDDERLELASHLRALARRHDPTWQAELGRRLGRCLSGQGHSSEELHQAHDPLSADGR